MKRRAEILAVATVFVGLVALVLPSMVNSASCAAVIAVSLAFSTG